MNEAVSKKAERTLVRSNRGLRVLKEAGKALLHAEHERELIQNICRIIVEMGTYTMAWGRVGYAQHDEARSVRPVGHWGLRPDYLDAITLTWDDSPPGQGPTGTAIRTNFQEESTFHDLLGVKRRG